MGMFNWWVPMKLCQLHRICFTEFAPEESFEARVLKGLCGVIVPDEQHQI